jgi:hypothetical protein
MNLALPLDVLLVDDGSTRGTPGEHERLALRYPEMRVLGQPAKPRQGPRGPARHR